MGVHPARPGRAAAPRAFILAKIVSDALNGIAWVDDSQIASANVEKIYGDIGQRPESPRT
jgi:hypothetical protein